MKISAISQLTENGNNRRNLFIRLSNTFMSAPANQSPIEKAFITTPQVQPEKPKKLGIENLQEFTIFPKEVKEGQTIITA